MVGVIRRGNTYLGIETIEDIYIMIVCFVIMLMIQFAAPEGQPGLPTGLLELGERTKKKEKKVESRWGQDGFGRQLQDITLLDGYAGISRCYFFVYMLIVAIRSFEGLPTGFA